MSGLSLVVGSSGQDGVLLCSYLTSKEMTWIGIDVDNVSCYGMPYTSFGNSINISKQDDVDNIVRDCKPSYIYYLAAHHHSASVNIEKVGEYFKAGFSVNVESPLNFLEAIRKFSPNSRFLYTSSSLIYAPLDSSNKRITESSPTAPSEVYALEKYLTGCYCREYRVRHNVYASVAIPFNHESAYRRPGFFTRDVTDAVAEISCGRRQYWEVGSLETIVDWSHASDVVSAFELILSLDRPDDFIISSGQGHTTGEFIKIACEYAGVDYIKAIRIKPDKIHRHNHCRIGDSSKLRTAAGWYPTISFEALVENLMQAAFDRLSYKQIK